MRRTRLPSLAILLLMFLVVSVPGAKAQGLDLPASGALGSLVITADPGTSILWDENALGTVGESGQMEISDIPLGSYSVTFRKSGIEDWVQSIAIIVGSQTLNRLAPAPAASLPDPFAEQSTPYVSIGFVAFLVAIAAGALFLGRRRHRLEPEEDLPLEPDGPKVVMAEPSGRRRPPGFYEDLRQRETVLESFEDRGSNRPRPKVIELPVVDHRSVEEG